MVAHFSAFRLTCHTVLLPLALWLGLGSIGPASAQIVPDGTLPSNSIVTPAGPLTTITGGTTRGTNLFHSFQQFSLPSGTAFFDNAATIQNIITRVTGGLPSNIDGILQANGTANLFLINPSGIQFGANARLNLGGSFVASTAQSMQFADGTLFSAVAPQNPLLTISVPIGLQYGASPAPITVQGNGNNTALDFSTFQILSNINPGLQVANGKTLALVGGDLLLNGGNLLAPEGNIELGSVRSGGLVNLVPTTTGWTLGYAGVANFGDIRLENRASADTSGNGGGSMQLQSGTLSVLGGSTILALTQGDVPGAGITIRATDRIEVSAAGVTADDVFNQVAYLSAIATDTSIGSTARGGNLSITTNTLRVSDGAQLSAVANGSGRGGDLSLNAQNVDITGGITGLTSSALSTAVNFGPGQGGDLLLNVGNLRVLNGAQLNAGTFDAGNAGGIKINAQSVLVDGIGDLSTSDIVSSTNLGPGNSGRIEINADRLQVTNGGRIATSTFTAGNGGELVINAKDLEVTGESSRGPSRIATDTETLATGNGGRLAINSDRLQIRDGGRISSDTFGAGNGGDIFVTAQDIQVLGTTASGHPSLFLALAQPGSTGNAGNLTLATNRLQVAGGAQVVAATSSVGNSGNLTVNANSIELSGVGPKTRSGLFGNALKSTGAGGDVRVTADSLTLRDGATINVGNFPSNNPNIAPGQGAVGNAEINARQIQLDNGSITADSAGGSGGNLFFNADTLVLRRGSSISTNAQGAATGGNITINTDFLVAVQGENSDITANAVNNFGGRVIIDAQTILGTAYRLQLTPGSDITATSALGPLFNGVVEIRTPDVDPSQGLTQLPSGLVDASSQIVAACERLPGSQFLVSGRGGLPQDASQPLRSGGVWQDLRPMAGSGMAVTSPTPPVSVNPSRPIIQIVPQVPLVEAQGWGITAEGKLALVAHAQPGAPSPPKSWMVQCPKQ
jgi:filamentous hemagglutinin family protein